MSKDKKGRFLEIVCKRCRNRQVVFGKSSSDVKCNKCSKLLVKPKGGKAKIRTWIREVFWRGRQY